MIGLLALRGLFTAFWTTASISWLRDLVPRELLGGYFSQRFAHTTIAMAMVAFGGSFFVRWWQGIAAPENAIFAYSFLLIGGWVLLGLSGPLLVTGVREPLMPSAMASSRSAMSILLEPLRDANFFRSARYLLLSSFALNLAVPFFVVYMLTRLGWWRIEKWGSLGEEQALVT